MRDFLNDHMTLNAVLVVLPIALGGTAIAVVYFAFIGWIKGLIAADTFAADFISENADVAAIEEEHPVTMKGWKGWRA